MKTSIKLLLFFVGILGLLMLAADVVLWAYYKKGVNGDGSQIVWKRSTPITTPLRPYKALVVKTYVSNSVSVVHGDKFAINYYGDDWDAREVDKSRVGDTLFLHARGMDLLTLEVPSIDYIRMDGINISVSIRELDQPAITVVGQDDCQLNLDVVKIGQVTYTGGWRNSVNLMGGGAIDSMQIKIGTQGSINGYNVPVKSLVIVADSLQRLNLEGKTSNGLRLQKN